MNHRKRQRRNANHTFILENLRQTEFKQLYHFYEPPDCYEWYHDGKNKQETLCRQSLSTLVTVTV